jgi:tetratricopeptide (TPR) repeat protein
MDHPMREYGGKRFNALPGDEVFFHLLRCPHCRDMALAQFGVHETAAAPPPPAPGRKKPAVAAESAFNDASFFLSDDPPERGLYCRALALLRWDQGQLDEAAALLRYAACAYGEKEDKVEEGACLALLGLLYTEAEEFFPAVGPLLRAQLALAPGQRHRRLLARSHLSLLLCLAEEGRQEEVRELMSTALALEAIVEGEEERARTPRIRERAPRGNGPPAAGQDVLPRITPDVPAPEPAIGSAAMDLKSHPTDEQLERFVLDRTGAEENRAIVLHRLGSCPECQRVMRARWYRTESALAKLVLVALPEEIRRMRRHS